MSKRLSYMPGLDGLRALAVVAVLLYHAELRWIPGGFLGVEVFFVISGYLITSLLLTEWHQGGLVAFKDFWLRRARRLIPALFASVIGTLAFAILFLPQEVASLRGDALAAFGYMSNWYLVVEHQSYFESVGRPSLLRHLWSLAVEGQFYLLWPLLFAVLMRHLRRRYVVLAVLSAAAASTILMAILYQPDIDPSRIYYGTDTRAAGLLIGAALALVWIPTQRPILAFARLTSRGGTTKANLVTRLGRIQAPPKPPVIPVLPQTARLQASRGAWIPAFAGMTRTGAGMPGQLQASVNRSLPWLLDAIGLAALVALAGFFARLDEFQPFLYWGGFASVALTTAIVIAVVVHPRAHLGSGLLGRQPLRWIGLRSYSIYLWHWPVFMVTRPHLDVPIDGISLFVLRLAVTGVLAELSYRYVEKPFRAGALGQNWRALREARGARRGWLGIRWAGVISSVAVLGVLVSCAKSAPPPAYLTVGAIHTVTSAPALNAAAITPSPVPSAIPTQPLATPTPTVAPTPVPSPGSPSAGSPAMPSSSAGPSGQSTGLVTAVGDSVMLGAATEMERAFGRIEIDAAVSRQVANVIDILRAQSATGQLGSAVVIHAGSNGTFSTRQFDEIMQLLAGVPRVVFVNVKVPRRWEEADNTVLAEGVKRYPNAVLVDWRSASLNHPEYFWDDGIHLRPEGARVYADLIAAAIKSSVDHSSPGYL